MNKFLISLLDSDDYQCYILAHMLVKDWNSKFIGLGKDGRKYTLFSSHLYRSIQDHNEAGRNFKWTFIHTPLSKASSYKYFTHAPDDEPIYH